MKESDNFYVRAKFGTKARIGPYGGITFNMEDADNGNYVMMRSVAGGLFNLSAVVGLSVWLC